MICLRNEEARQYYTMGTAIALGKFDGIHIGHQVLIEGLRQEKKLERKALVFTFGSNPGVVLRGGTQKSIYTSLEKAYYFSELGIDVLLEYPFTKEFAALPPETFVYECLVRQLGVRAVYVGEDFRFGKGRMGNVALLQELGQRYDFRVHAIPKKTLHGRPVSSTGIRDMLETNFHVANEMLGNPYFIYGEVVHGRHLGHAIGYPTINQLIPGEKMVPGSGVYASRVCIEGNYYPAISNLGNKPTIEGSHRLGLETHILNYQNDLYGKYLKTELLFFIRPEEKFRDVSALKKQIRNDIDMMLEQR